MATEADYYLTPKTEEQPNDERIYYLTPKIIEGDPEYIYYLTPKGITQKNLIGIFGINGNDGYVYGAGEAFLDPGEFDLCAFTITLPSQFTHAQMKATSGAWCSHNAANKWRTGVGFITSRESDTLGTNWHDTYFPTQAEAEAAWSGYSIAIKLGTDKKLGWYVNYNVPNDPTDDSAYFKIYGLVLEE